MADFKGKDLVKQGALYGKSNFKLERINRILVNVCHNTEEELCALSKVDSHRQNGVRT